jgi:hypothetical protein
MSDPRQTDPRSDPSRLLGSNVASFCREIRGFAREEVSYADELGLKLALCG